MSNTIPDDVMRAASEFVEAMPPRPPFKADVEAVVARAILAERIRCAEVAQSGAGWIRKFLEGKGQASSLITSAILNPPSSRSSSTETTPDEITPSQASPVPNSDWITWNGGECPVPDGRDADISLRNGQVMTGIAPDHWDWNHGYDIGDIIAYRIIPANLTQHEVSL